MQNNPPSNPTPDPQQARMAEWYKKVTSDGHAPVLNFWMTVFNALMLAVTVILAAIAIWQGNLSKGALDAARESVIIAQKSLDVASAQLKDARDAAPAAEARAVAAEGRAERMTKANEDISKAASGQAKAAQATARSSERGVKVAFESLQTAQSAYLILTGAAISEIKVGKKIITSLAFTNKGNTPAYEVEIWSNLALRDTPVPSPMPPLLDSMGDRGKGIVAPNSPVQHNTEMVVAISDELNQGIQQKLIKVYTWGFVTYKDIFGRRQRVEFCLVHNNLGTNTFDACSGNNGPR
jgi:hypothetical protein